VRGVNAGICGLYCDVRCWANKAHVTDCLCRIEAAAFRGGDVVFVAGARNFGGAPSIVIIPALR
jgi:hypothetical protein